MVVEVAKHNDGRSYLGRRHLGRHARRDRVKCSKIGLVPRPHSAPPRPIRAEASRKAHTRRDQQSSIMYCRSDRASVGQRSVCHPDSVDLFAKNPCASWRSPTTSPPFNVWCTSTNPGKTRRMWSPPLHCHCVCVVQLGCSWHSTVLRVVQEAGLVLSVRRGQSGNLVA